MLTVIVAGRGKNDPTERRRIQNRINQRAFRRRQRAGECPRQYKSRSTSDSKSQREEESGSSESGSDSSASDSPHAEARSLPAPTGNQSSGATHTTSGLRWDELARLIHRNFMAAAVMNAQHLGLDLTALQIGTAVLTNRPTDRPVPLALTPVEQQYQVPHDPIIDVIPHARLRFNILRAIATGQLDAAAFTRCVRGSGVLEQLNGNWQRGGLVVWSFPEQLASWELSELFVRKWARLLQGCEDLIAATNAWRSRRGEGMFPLPLERSDVRMRY